MLATRRLAPLISLLLASSVGASRRRRGKPCNVRVQCILIMVSLLYYL